MSAITRVPEKTSGSAYSYEFDFDTTPRKKNGGGKTLTELCSIDVVFFATFSICGLFLGTVPVVTIATHLLLSTTCVLCDVFISKSKKSSPALTAFFVFCCTFIAWVDALFIVQTTCRYSESNTRPSGFGITTSDLTLLFVLVSAHVVSMGSAVCTGRALCTNGWTRK